MPPANYDFAGYATKNDVKCSDGVTIRKNAFLANDGTTVPLVWQHMHDTVDNVLGHCVLENREDGVYAYGYFNETPSGKIAKTLVRNKDIVALSIWANQLKKMVADVVHGVIREVSLVHSGANPGAFIEQVSISHSDGSWEDSDDDLIFRFIDETPTIKMAADLEHADGEDLTIGEILKTLSDVQQGAVYYLLEKYGEAMQKEQADPVAHSDLQEEETPEAVAHSVQTSVEEKELPQMQNIFEVTHSAPPKAVLSQMQFSEIMETAKTVGSLKKAILQHAGDYGVKNIEMLFPDAQDLSAMPEFVMRDQGWVTDVLQGANHSPFSRIRTASADLTYDTARAKGYITATMKEVSYFEILDRETTPQTIYNKSALDRDDELDVTGLDVVAMIKWQQRQSLDEEVARAALVGDGRAANHPQKIKHDKVRPIWLEDDFYATKISIPAVTTTKEIIKTIKRSRKHYKGSGSPVFFTTEDFLTELLLIEDTTGRLIYETEASLCAALRVTKIITVPVMDGLQRVIDGTPDVTMNLLGITVNMKDYTFGATKGGQVSFFEDFDLDYNQKKFLVETRTCGALTKPKCAIVFEQVAVTP